MTELDKPFVQLSRLYDLAHRDLQSAMKANRKIELTILVLSAITAGSLWALVAESLPTGAKWVAAVTASLVTILTAYQTSLGPKKKLESLLPMFQKLAEAIGKFRDGEPIGWSDYKKYLAEMTAVGVHVPIGPPRKTPDELARMTPSERLAYQQETEQSVPQ